MVALLGVAFAIVSAFGLAGQALGIRLATRRGESAHVLLVNIGITAVVFVILSVVFVQKPIVTPRSVLAFVGAGLVSFVVARGLYFAGIKRVGASRSEPIKASMPLHATVFAVLILGEDVTGPQFVGILLIIVGIALVSWEGAQADHLVGKSVPWFGLSLPLVAAVFFGLEPILASIGFREGTSILVGGAIKSVAGVIILFGFLIARDSVPRYSDLPTGDVRWYIFSGFASSVSMLAYYGGLNVARVSIVVPIMQMSPLIVVSFSAVFLRGLERVTLRLVVAAAVIIVGAVIVTVVG